MVLSKITQTHIAQRLGMELMYSSDYEHLAYDIERRTKRRIGLNTIKRLFGTIDSINEPRLYTLNTIAAYLGYQNWASYIASMSKAGNSTFYKEYEGVMFSEILSEHLTPGQKVEFQYLPDRIVNAEFITGEQYRIVESRNSKLKINDLIYTKGYYLNYPLIIQDVIREGINLGRFTAAEVSGLTHLELIHQDAI